MTNQEIFTKVVTHLRKQGRQAMSPGGSCMYRAPDGAQCAAGCLIADEHYSPSIEHLGARNTPVADVLEASGVPKQSLRLVHCLQQVHDALAPFVWESRWALIAKDFGLEVPA